MIESELKALFGPVVASECWGVPTALEVGQARRIGQIAGVLSTERTPEGQRTLIQALPVADQLLLCRWLADRDYAVTCLSTGK